MGKVGLNLCVWVLAAKFCEAGNIKLITSSDNKLQDVIISKSRKPCPLAHYETLVNFFCILS